MVTFAPMLVKSDVGRYHTVMCICGRTVVKHDYCGSSSNLEHTAMK